MHVKDNYRVVMQKVTLGKINIDKYKKFNPNLFKKINTLAQKFANKKIVHVSATAIGGGVVEILSSEVPLLRSLGINTQWYIIPPNEDFFKITKSIHNFLQGKEGNLTSAEKNIYLEHNKHIAKLLEEIKADILIMHDPQPAAALGFMSKNKLPKFAILRSHIDTSHPNKKVWDFMKPFWEPYDRYVFTLADYVNEGIPRKDVSLITPAIDPLSKKNVKMPLEEARAHLVNFGIKVNKPIVTQISRFDPWKDPLGVIDAFMLAKKKIPKLQLALMAQSATDDPEGQKVYKEVKNYSKGKPDIFILLNPPDNDRSVNSLQTAADVVLQKSTREGFGLTVTEAMWKGAVVIGGNVGGIKLQIEDGVNGFLVNSPEETAERIIYVLEHLQHAEKISKEAHRSVKNKYLMTNLIYDYLKLWRSLL